MIYIKTGVEPKMLTIMAAVSNAAQALEVNVTITSGQDGKHMKGSLHYTGCALDVRSKNFKTKEDKLSFLDAVNARLGNDYQGILESLGRENEHFHFEYDPS